MFPKGGQSYPFGVTSANPPDAAGRQSGYRSDAAPREAIAPAHVLYLLGPLPSELLVPVEALAGGLDHPVRQASTPGVKGALHLREDDV